MSEAQERLSRLKHAYVPCRSNVTRGCVVACPFYEALQIAFREVVCARKTHEGRDILVTLEEVKKGWEKMPLPLEQQFAHMVALEEVATGKKAPCPLYPAPERVRKPRKRTIKRRDVY